MEFPPEKIIGPIYLWVKFILSVATHGQNAIITKASKVFTQIFGLVRWFGPPVLLTGGP